MYGLYLLFSFLRKGKETVLLNLEKTGLCGNLVGISINLGSMEIMAKWMKRKVSKYK